MYIVLRVTSSIRLLEFLISYCVINASFRALGAHLICPGYVAARVFEIILDRRFAWRLDRCYRIRLSYLTLAALAMPGVLLKYHKGVASSDTRTAGVAFRIAMNERYYCSDYVLFTRFCSQVYKLPWQYITGTEWRTL